jgi:primosomal protein N' (replication factor Y)
VDLRATPGDSSLSPDLGDALRKVGAGGRRAVLVVNRLGYGWGLGCVDCGAVPRCPGCRIALTYHRSDRSLVCRLCGLRLRAASQCGRCRGRRLAPLGLGTERVEDDVRRAAPGVRVARYDGDLTDAQAAAVRAGFRDRRVQVVVGTHMALRLLADGPVDLTALVLADATLSLPDFRAAERTFQLAWHLAEGVAPGGSAWIQSYYPEHPALEAVAVGGREAFYEREWAERRELGYPPARRMARLLAAGRDAPVVIGGLAERCRAEGLTVLGPATLMGGRAEIAVLGEAGMVDALARVLAPLRGRRRLARSRLSVDVDPVELA